MQKTSLLVFILLSSAAYATDPARTVKVLEAQLQQAKPLPLEDVRLTDGPLKNAQDRDAEILLDLKLDRMLAYYRIVAGLEPKAKGYGGWDGGGRNLTGHIAGHYLSGVSLMYATTGDKRFKERANYIVREFQLIQDKHGDGYLSALAEGRQCWADVKQGKIRSGGFDLNGQWAPWYTLHKTFAGLRDAYRYTGNTTALEIERKFAAWVEEILSPLSHQQIQKMLNTEFGGMNEVMVDLYADTGDPRWLDLSYKFEHESFIEPLKQHVDILAGKHGNTQVPKLIGSADRFAYTGNAGDLLAAAFFWDRVVKHHSYATGGHGKNEYFGRPDELTHRVDGRTCETCNVYNMLRLTRRLFELFPDTHYADFQERALFNHILASQDPDEGWACYMVPVGRDVQHEYERNMLDGGFTCCTGSSFESHALHADGIYYVTEDNLQVNLYTPSRATWRDRGVTLQVDTDLPLGDTVSMKLSLEKSQTFTLALRRPYWTDERFTVTVNDKTLDEVALSSPRIPPYGRLHTTKKERRLIEQSYFVHITRCWEDGDSIMITLPKSLRLEPLPDNPQRVAILWGPLVLAGDLGPERSETKRHSWTLPERPPIFTAAKKPIAEWLKPIPDKQGQFRSDNVGQDRDITFIPFYQLHRRRYGIYWDLFTPAEWKVQAAQYAAEDAQRRNLEAATIAYAQPGEMQPERNFNFQTGDKYPRPMRTDGRPGRRADTWFSFDLPVDATVPMTLVVTYCSAEWRFDDACFSIEIDGQHLVDETIKRDEPICFYDEVYALPSKHFEGKEKVTITFRAHADSSVAGVYGLRIVRKDADLTAKTLMKRNP